MRRKPNTVVRLPFAALQADWVKRFSSPSNIPDAAGEVSCFSHRQRVFRAIAPLLTRPPLWSQAGNATAYASTDIVMDVVIGNAPFELVIEGLDQESSESAGYGVRVSATNSAGYGRPSTALNIKVITDAAVIFGRVFNQSGMRMVPTKTPGIQKKKLLVCGNSEAMGYSSLLH